MRRQKLVLLTAFMGCAPFVAKVSAQESPQDTIARAENLEEVTIQAVRAQESAPVPQVTINKKEIEEIYTGQDAAFLLHRLSPSIVSYSESGTSLSNYGGIRLRGIDQTRINMTLNGVPLNDMIDQGVFFSNFIDFGNSVESVQIQRGVGTSTNGVASYAGSINFESISLAHSQPRAEVQLTGGSFNTARASAEVNTGLMENRTAFYTRFSHVQSDGYRRHTGTNSNSLFFSGGYFGDKHALKFTGFAGRSRNELGYTPVAISNIQQDPRTNYISPNDEDDFGQYLFQLQHTYRTGTRSSLVNTVYYGGAGGDFPVYGDFDENGEFEQTNYPLYNDHIGAMSQYNHESADRNTKLNAGVHAYTFHRNNIEYIIPNRTDPYYDDRTQKDEAAAFVKVRHELGPVELFGDVQARAVRLGFHPDEGFLDTTVSTPDREYLFINPKVGATYTVNPNWQVYASFGRSGREPTRYDILGSPQLNRFNLHMVTNVASVDPEYVNDLEGGVRFSTENARFEVNYFYMQFENEIAPIGEYIPEGFVQVYRNQERSYRTGVELHGSWRFAPMFELRAQATYMQARITSYTDEESGDVYDDVVPILTPDWNTQATLAFEPTDGLQFMVIGRYLSESYMELTNDPEFTVPRSMVMDVQASWRFWRDHSLSIQMNNIFDELYYTYGAPSTVVPGEPAYFVQPPRHIYATLFLRF